MGLLDNYFKNDALYRQKYGTKCIFLIQCGSFFEVYGVKGSDGKFVTSSIENFSKVCDMAIAAKCSPGKAKKKQQTYKGQKVFMAGFSGIETLDKYVIRLTQNGYVVPVWTQDEKVKTMRSEFKIFTPGTCFELGNNNNITNNSMCIWLEKKGQTLLNKNPMILCGMSTIDIYTGCTQIFEFKERYFHSPTTYDEIERFYSTHHPTEIIFIHNCEEAMVDEIINFAAIECPTIHKISSENTESLYFEQLRNCQKQIYQKELLEQFYTIKDYDNFYESQQFREYPMATISFCFLLNFISQMQPELVNKMQIPIFNNRNDRLILANHSSKQLNLVNNSNYMGRYSSVESFLNRCKTAMGRRKIKQQLLNPTTDSHYLKREYAIIQYVKDTFVDFEKMTHGISQICDFERLYRKFALKKAVPAELIHFLNNLKYIKTLDKELQNDELLKKYISQPNLSLSNKKFGKTIEKNIRTSVASRISTHSFDENIFKRGIYPDLDVVAAEYTTINEKLECARCYIESILSKYEKKKKNAQYVKEHSTEKKGLYFEITNRRSLLLKNALKEEKMENKILSYRPSYKDERKRTMNLDIGKISFKTGTSSNKRIESPILNKLYIDQLQAKERMRKKLKEVYHKFLDSLLHYKEEMEELIRFVVKIDLLYTKAKLAIDFNYCCPKIDETKDKSFLEAVNMRHILIEHLQHHEIYVPNDISLGNGDQDGILLYGTNAVGKSSLIKSIGICVVMAQAGFFVPCDRFSFKPYERLFTRILGNDNIFKGLSTFAVEMSELQVILRNAHHNSMVLGDEVCSGTETISAISIFLSALFTLKEKRSSFIFATHLHEITEFDYLRELEGVVLKHMGIHCDEHGIIIYDRKLKNGSGSNIYGLEVCKSLQMPQSFLEKAYSIRSEISPQNQSILTLSQSRYNSNKVKKNCELCGKDATDIHHMYPQKDATKKGHIGTFHKNHVANLMSICVECHKKQTKNQTKSKKKKTSDGYRSFVEIAN